MATLIEAKAKIRELSQKALEIAESKTMTVAQMKTALNGPDGKSGLEADIKKWEAEAAYLEGRKGYGFLADSPDGTPAGYSADNPGVKALGRAPALQMGEQDARAMFAALKNAQTFKVDLKDVRTDSGAAAVGLLNPEMFPGVVPLQREPVRILDHIPSVATGSDAVSWITHGSTTGTAGTVPAGGLKPQAFPNLTKQTLFMRKIAVYALENEETIEDFASFMQFLDVELKRLVIAAENDQLVNGDGTGENILGLLNVSGILTRAKGSDTNPDVLEMAIADLRTGSAFTEPDALIINPSTWSLVRRTKSTTGEYLFGDPTSKESSDVWGVPVLPTTSMPTGTALMANLTMAATGIIRAGITVRTSNSSGDSFQRNEIAFVTEERLNLGINYPAALLKITGLA